MNRKDTDKDTAKVCTYCTVRPPFFFIQTVAEYGSRWLSPSSFCPQRTCWVWSSNFVGNPLPRGGFPFFPFCVLFLVRLVLFTYYVPRNRNESNFFIFWWEWKLKRWKDGVLYRFCIWLRTGDESRERGKHRRQAPLTRSHALLRRQLVRSTRQLSLYRTACHGHVSLYVTANKPAGGKNKTQIKHFPGSV